MKDYTFTSDEMFIIRDALVEYYLFLQDRVISEDGKKRMRRLEALKDQFKTDCANMKEGK